MNINLMAHLYKQSKGSLGVHPASNSNQLQKEIIGAYHQINAFFTHQYWNSLADLEQHTLHNLTGWGRMWHSLAVPPAPNEWITHTK